MTPQIALSSTGTSVPSGSKQSPIWRRVEQAAALGVGLRDLRAAELKNSNRPAASAMAMASVDCSRVVSNGCWSRSISGTVMSSALPTTPTIRPRASCNGSTTHRSVAPSRRTS
jgi:hypothetical protein